MEIVTVCIILTILFIIILFCNVIYNNSNYNSTSYNTSTKCKIKCNKNGTNCKIKCRSTRATEKFTKNIFSTDTVGKFDTLSNHAFAQYNPLATFISVVRNTESKKKTNIRTNIRKSFNDFVNNDIKNFTRMKKCDVKLIKNFIKRIEKNINAYSIIFFVNDYTFTCYSLKYYKDIIFTKINCTIINRDLQTSNYLEQGNITKIPVTIYVAITNKGDVIHTSVNGFNIEPDILRYADPGSKNYYYSAQMFNSNLDDPSLFGGYALITPDREALKKFCNERRKEINKYSYCKLNKVNFDGTRQDVYDQTVDEINCVAKGGEIVRINSPKFGLLFDNMDAITENINGDIEIQDMYLGEHDICADLSNEQSENDFNTLFDKERKHNKVVSF